MAASVHDILESHRTRTPVVMGILNVTPDSFADEGRFFDPAAAVEHARQMAAEGADIIDVGAESTRPGSDRVGPDEQIRRLEGVLAGVVGLGVPVSIDTTSAQVAEWALSGGAAIINDISAGRDDPAMLPLAGRAGVGLVLMHMLGEPKSMQDAPHYDDVAAEVKRFLAARVEAAVAAGVRRRNCIVDPGIGFGKSVEHNLALLADVQGLCELGQPVLIGASRKRFIGAVTGVSEPAGRLAGSLAAACAAYVGGASIFRVHDVAATRQALDVLRRITRLSSNPKARP
jgi:dihydropteroate synthase